MGNAAEVRTGGEIGPRAPGLPRVPGVPVSPTVLSILQSARRGLSEAADETSPGARYVTAHLAALRAAAAVVAARGEPQARGRQPRCRGDRPAACGFPGRGRRPAAGCGDLPVARGDRARRGSAGPAPAQ